MGTPTVLFGILAVSAYALVWIGLPILLTAWVRRRREEAIKRQIALTDAIHWRLGALVSPVVENPFWGPWRVRIAAPLEEPATVGKILAVAHAVLSASGAGSSRSYRVILTPRQDAPPETQVDRTHTPAERWSHTRSAATA